MRNREAELFEASTPQDVTSVRAKNERKGKVTADKWNWWPRRRRATPRARRLCRLETRGSVVAKRVD